MRCDEFEVRWHEVLDRRESVDAEAALREHLDACADCRELVAACDVLFEGLSGMSIVRPADDLAARVVAELRSTRAPRWRTRRTVLLLAAAAAVLIAALPLLRFDSSAPQGPRIAEPSLEEYRQLAYLTADRLALLRGGDSADQYDLARGTGRSLAVVVLHLPVVGGSFLAGDSFDPFASDQPAWVGPMTDGIRPLTTSVSEALNVLLKTLPRAESNTRS